jgi:hypothetical protein
VTSWRPRGNGIGSSNNRFEPLAALREEIGALLRERKISARRMHCDPAVLDGGGDRGDIFLSSAASRQELFVDGGDRQSPGMIGFHCVRQLEQFLLGDLGVGERAILFEFD